MEINRTSDDLGSRRGNVLNMPSGLEVESARFHLWKEKLSAIRSRSASKLTAAGQSARRQIDSVRSGVRGGVARAQNHLRTHPAQWTAAAVGVGIGLGLLGRLIRNRSRQSSEVIVITGAC